MELTPKQLKFCEEFAITRNATQAAINAGYAQKSARQQAARLMTKVNIKETVGEMLTESTQKAGVELTDVMLELKSILKATMADYAEWSKESVTFFSKNQLTSDQMKAIETISADGKGSIKIRLHNKLRAVELLIRLHEISKLETEIASIKQHLGIE